AKESLPFTQQDLEQSVHQRFGNIVRQHPDQVAVKMREDVVTYAQLNALANGLANTILARRGDQAEAVGILLSRGPRVIAASLGVLKTGKFFVPLDASFPKTRIATILDETQAGLLITDNQHVSLIPQAAQKRIMLDFESIDSAVSTE